MKILLVSDVDLPESHLFCGLSERKNEVYLICRHDAPYQDRLRKSGITIFHESFSGRFSLSAIRFIREKVKLMKPDIVHYFNSRGLSNGLIATIGINVKSVAYRGTVGHLSRYDPSAWLTFFNPRLNRIICVSEAVRSYLIKVGIASNKVVTIYKGHRCSWYNVASATRAEENIPENAIIVCCAANIRPVKGVDYLIRAFASLTNLHPNLHLLLVGEIRCKKVANLLKGLKNVHVKGYRRDVGSLIAMSDIFVMCSVEREGFPKAVIEAMSCGIPPIVTNVGGMVEMVQDHQDGLIVPPKNIIKLAKAILDLSTDKSLRTKLGQNAKESVELRFSIESTIDDTLRLYNELLL
jgi:glycosyltransferase involved in cell wall biosynthesis